MVSRRRLFDALFVSTLILYALAGMVQTPFHGDETTIIYMSRDWATLVQQGNISAIRYQPTYSDDQQLRLVNGVISTYAFGFAWSSFGLKVSDLPTAWWWWGTNWETNVKQGHLPNANLLFATRLASTFMMVLSISLIFASARLLSKQRWLPYCVTLVYATLPALLLDGRRAMFEGAAMLTSALVIFTALNLARLVRLKLAKAKLITGWILFSVACGFALATKFTTLVVVMAATGMLLLVGWQRPLNRFASVSAIIGAALVFLLLNPAWWAAPVQVFNEVVKDRQNIIKAQVDQYGAYTNLPARIAGLVTLPLSAPQYYEDTQNFPGSSGWSAWIGPQIADYERSGTAGIFWGPLAGVLWILGLLGLAGLRHVPSAERWVLLGIIIFTAIGTLVLNPLPWQRYYLPMAPSLAILIGLGVQESVVQLSRFRRQAPMKVADKSSI